MTGLTPAAFYRMSLLEFRLMQRGFLLKEKLRTQREWEVGRFIAFHSVAPHVKKGRVKNVHDIVKFEWENVKSELPTAEDKRYWILKYGKYLN